MENVQINLVACTAVLLQDIAVKQFSQKDIALTYAMAMKSAAQGADNPDWKIINEAIIARWSRSGLERVKKRAHGIFNGTVKV